MRRRQFLLSTSAAMLAAIAAKGDEGEMRSARPNIILCMADDQGWGDVGYYGHPVLKTPHLDDMASSGLRFDQFHAAAPVCSPTRASVLTGRHPNRCGTLTWGHSLRPQETTFVEKLREAGYVTGHFGKWHLGSVLAGSPVNPGAFGFDEWLSAPNFYDNDPILSRQGQATPLEGESSVVTMEAAMEFMARHAEGPQPFLAVVWFGSPHLPHRASQEDRALYADQPDELRDFYGEVTGIDRSMGILRQWLADSGHRQNTLLWYCSDNGGLPEQGSTGGRAAKGSVYQGGLRVPAIIEWPAAIPEARVTDAPCVTSDIGPTLLDTLGLPPLTGRPLDGVSLRPLVEGGRIERPGIGFWHYPAQGIPVYSERWMAELLEAQRAGEDLRPPDQVRADAGEIEVSYPEGDRRGHAAWRDGDWKLHRISGDDDEDHIELYNLVSDPMESTDLASSERARAHRMLLQLERWQASVVGSMNGEDYG